MIQAILDDIQANYGLSCKQIMPIQGGWLNKLWKASTNAGEIVIKQYSNQRFSCAKLSDIEAALKRQCVLYESGLACPKIFLLNGRAIRMLDDTTAYTVMQFCRGKNASAHSITAAQMQSLGSACAHMHRAFSALQQKAVKGYPINHAKLLTSLHNNLSMHEATLSHVNSDMYHDSLIMHKSILHGLTAAFFDRFPLGIAHEDFTSDNILFEENSAAIIDFDRNQYSYISHDIGRAILSFALMDNKLNLYNVHTFVKGYAQHIPLNIEQVADALRLTWCIEVPWWIQPAYFTMPACKATRFRDEILWVSRHYFELNDMLM